MLSTFAREAAARLMGIHAYSLAVRIAREHNVTVDDMLGRGRGNRIPAARHHLWALMRWTLDLSYPELGALFGVDHSTIMAGIRRHESRCSRGAAA